MLRNIFNFFAASQKNRLIQIAPVLGQQKCLNLINQQSLCVKTDTECTAGTMNDGMSLI